jgi:FkbM family methyltransferase
MTADPAKQNRFDLTFSVAAFVAWVARCLIRKLRGQPERYYLPSPSYAGRQAIVDVRRGETLHIHARDSIDIEVLRQVFASEDYRLSRLKRYNELMQWLQAVQFAGGRPLVLDLGANTGLASLYFSREFPDARILAVEPEVANAELARRAVSGHGDVNLITAGIASSDGRATIVDPGQGNWAYRTELAPDGVVSMLGVQRLIADHADEDCVPFIAKVNIEGFESELFSRNVEWADRFPMLIIELDDWMLPGVGSAQNFLRWAAARARDFIYIGENIFSIARALPEVRPGNQRPCTS